jgi:uncharacterized protein YfaT (DUF1175 family)
VRVPAALVTVASTLLLAMPTGRAQVRLADESDRAAFRAWFVLLAEAQFEHANPEVADCAALVRFSFREALRAHTPEWARRVALPFTPQFPDVRSAPPVGEHGWPLFRVTERPPVRHAEFADARTLVGLNTSPVGRDASRARPGDLLYFNQPGQRQPDHLMVVVGPSHFGDEGTDWVVYHTGPSDEGPGDVRKVRLSTLVRHPAPQWRPLAVNPHFLGVFRLTALATP